MTTKTQTKPRRQRRSMIFGLDRAQLLPLDLTDLPAAIVKANKTAHAAFDELEEAQAKAHELAAQANAAERHDQLATEAALAAGEKAPKATLGRKQAAAEEAKRTAQALERVTKIKIRDLYDTIEDNLDGFRATVRHAAIEACEPLREIVPKLREQLLASGQAVQLDELARIWHNNPASAVLGPGAGRSSLERRFGRALASQREHARMRPNDVPDLAEALAVLAVALERERVIDDRD